MPALSLLDEADLPKGSDFQPLAIVSARGSLDGKFLVLDKHLDDEIEPARRLRSIEIDPSKYAHHLRGMKPRDKTYWLSECARAVRHGTVLPEACPVSVRRAHEAMQADAAIPRSSDEFWLPPGATFDLLPPLDGRRACHFVAGPSGSGKSFFAAAYALRWQKINPGKHMYILTRSMVDEDPAYTKLPLNRIEMADLLKEPVDVNTAFGGDGALVIVDDAEAWHTKQEQKACESFVRDLLSLGRKPKLDVIVTSHKLADHSRTSLLWHECDTFTCFPGLNPRASLSYALKKAGLEHVDIDVLRRAGRAVTLSLRAPQWVLSERMARLER